jgi:subtilase family protein
MPSRRQNGTMVPFCLNRVTAKVSARQAGPPVCRRHRRQHLIHTGEATVSEPALRSAILASRSVNRPGEIDRLNAILADAGLGRPLGPPERNTPTVSVLPVSGDVDPHRVIDTLRQTAPGAGELRLQVLSGYRVDTVADNNAPPVALVATVPLLAASGLKSGHGTVSWTAVPAADMPPAPPWHPASSAPVVVVLDSGVKPHTWLPRDGGPPFCIEPAMDPSSGLPLPDTAPLTGQFHGYWGHATFLAGLIRLTAPDAKVISIKLMNDDGTLSDDDLASALDWLIKYTDEGHLVDVVLMAFGRPKQPGEDNPASLDWQLGELGSKGVTIVASAGNAGLDNETIPACLAADPYSPVVSVGAGTSPENREPYSNYGPWVREWRTGTVTSLMPLTQDLNGDRNGFALWSGTSFSAAIVAGELAHARAAARAAGPQP